MRLGLRTVELAAASPTDVVVRTEWSGISTGTERLLYNGSMPAFPGMGYPLVPGYESVGRIILAGDESGRSVGQRVFVPGSRAYTNIRGLFGGAASQLVAPGSKTVVVPETIGEDAILLALAATAHHAMVRHNAPVPELIIGHGVLGRLLARVSIALGNPAPAVWETNLQRSSDAQDYPVLHPDQDERRDYRAIYDVSGDESILDQLIGRLAAGGEVVLAGFYTDRLHFGFVQAFMREARISISAEWQPADLLAVRDLVYSGTLSLGGLITHRSPASSAEHAYRVAFSDAGCLKMVLEWDA